MILRLYNPIYTWKEISRYPKNYTLEVEETKWIVLIGWSNDDACKGSAIGQSLVIGLPVNMYTLKLNHTFRTKMVVSFEGSTPILINCLFVHQYVKKWCLDFQGIKLYCGQLYPQNPGTSNCGYIFGGRPIHPGYRSWPRPPLEGPMILRVYVHMIWPNPMDPSSLIHPALRGIQFISGISDKVSLVGGWTNPFEKYARQIGSFPQGSGWK